MMDPVYFIPGWGFKSSIFSNDLGEWKGIALDYFYWENLSIKGIALQLAQLIEKPAVIVAWSLGGLFAIKIASLFPEKIKKLILLSSQPKLTADNGYSGIDPKTLEIFMAMSDFEMLKNKFIGLVGFPDRNISSRLSRYFIVGYQKNLLALLNLILATDLRDEYRKLSTDILHIIGAKDAVLRQNADCLLALNANVKTACIAKAGHSGFLTHASSYCLAINHFIKRNYE